MEFDSTVVGLGAIGILLTAAAIIGGGLEYKDIKIPIISSPVARALLSVFGIILLGTAMWRAGWFGGGQTPVDVDPTLTSAPTEAGQTTDATENANNGREEDAAPTCVTPSAPPLPCVMQIGSGTSLVDAAEAVYGDAAYAVAVINFNRTEDGYRPGVGSAQMVYFPTMDEIGDVDNPNFPSEYAACVPLAEGEGAFPCVYTAVQGDNYVKLADRFYGFDASGCIEAANFSYAAGTNNLEALTKIVGRLLLLPVRTADYC